MEVQSISQQAFSIYITDEELSRRRLSPGNVTAADAMALVSELTGRRPTVPTRLELFPGRHELLIFVTQSFGKLRFFQFDALEDVIGAALESAFDDPSSLFCYQDRYILAIWCAASEEPCALWEFGKELFLQEGFLPHLYEHGQTIADGCALSRLRAAFG